MIGAAVPLELRLADTTAAIRKKAATASDTRLQGLQDYLKGLRHIKVCTVHSLSHSFLYICKQALTVQLSGCEPVFRDLLLKARHAETAVLLYVACLDRQSHAWQQGSGLAGLQ